MVTEMQNGRWNADGSRKFRTGAHYFLMTAAVAILIAGCKPKETAVPETPPDAVEVIIDGLKDNQPEVLWEALPASYQLDIRSLIDEFCNHMDPEMYSRGWKIFEKFAEVMDKKEDFIFNSPELLSTPIFESNITQHWGDLTRLLNSIAESKISTLDSLRLMDPGKFLETTGHEVMKGSKQLGESMGIARQLNALGRGRGSLDQMTFDFSETSETSGSLKITPASGNRTQDVEMIKVEGRWVPAEMAEDWDAQIAEAKAQIATLSGEEFQKTKPVITMVLNTLDTSMDSLLRAESQQEFDQTLKALKSIGDLAGSMQRRQ